MAQGSGAPLGFGQFWRRDDRSVHLGRIIVSPHERGRGYGKTLCSLLISEALCATNAEAITLRVYRDNAPAFSIYSNLGFLIVESESNEEVFAMEARADLAVQGTPCDKATAPLSSTIDGPPSQCMTDRNGQE
jgi:[ribosomal protein S18]-alanine N-acetyltransferase